MATKKTLPTDLANKTKQAGQQVRGSTTTTTKPGGQVSPSTTSGTTTTTVAPGTSGGWNGAAELAAAMASLGGGSGSMALVPTAVINMTGIEGAGGKSQRLTAKDWQKSLDRYTPEQLSALQQQLWEGGFYTNEFYYQNGPRPIYGNKMDEGLRPAYQKFITLASNYPETKAVDILSARRTQYANSIANVNGSGGANSLNVMVEPTQVMRVPTGDVLGMMADEAAKSVLGRSLKPGDERDKYVAWAKKTLMDAGMTEADIDAYNRGLTRQAAGQEVAYSNTQAANIASGLTGSMADYAGAIRAIESGSGNPAGDYKATSKKSSASGAYQVLKDTWNNYKGWKTAAEAPAAVQDEFFAKTFGAYLQKYGTPELAAVAWFQGGGVADRLKKGDKSVLGKTDANNTSTNLYIKKFQSNLAKVTGKAAPGAQGSTAGGMRTVSTITGDYQGSVSTPSGGNVVITPDNSNIRAMLEAQIKKDNPEESAAVGFRRGADVFARLMGGGY